MRFRTQMLLGLSLLCSASQAQQVKVEAVPGTPFGVGRVVLPLDSYIDSEKLDSHYIGIGDAEGRVLYPAIRYTQPLQLIREVLGIPSEGAPSELHMHFLFKGNGPLDLVLHLPERQSITVVPNGRPAAYKRLLRAWWVRYKAAARKQRAEGDYSPIVETYLTSMLARRLGLPAVRLQRPDANGSSLSMMLGTEAHRLAMLQESVYGTKRNEPLDFSLPAEIEWPDVAIPSVPVIDEQVEEIARHVPEECFYIRFAQFPNYLWLRRLLEEYGGDLSRMVMLRGTDSQLNQRVENQLGLRESSLSRVLGPQVISDVAMIGRDTYLREGAAIGILFEAKSEVLKNELMNQRRTRVRELADAGAKMGTIMLGDDEVSFASTPHNELRSFYVQDGKYHLVTNSRRIAERFLECGRGERTLADAAEFHYARSLIPLGDENTLFVYLSRRFFQGLLSPQYQVEVERRLRSVTDTELMQLATLAAVAEGYGSDPITAERLVDLGFIGSRADLRSDGSYSKVVDGKTVDSLRGRRGTFLPIPDTPIQGISRREADRVEQTNAFHRRSWQQMDPVLIGIRRSALDNETERVEIQARMLPLNREQYGIFTEIFGPPTTRRIKSSEQDIISVQAYVDGGPWPVTPHHLYFGIRDAAPKTNYSERRFLKSLQVMRTAPAYVAAWPRPGFLDSIGLGGRPIGDGYSRMLLGLFRLDVPNGFTLLSFDQQLLANVAPTLSVEEVESPRQLHVYVGDIKNSKFGGWANDLDFQRAWETSVGNVQLLHILAQQLHVPLGQAKEIVEHTLDAQLFCPLGGEYQLIENPDGTLRWASSAWVTGKEEARKAYVSPLMGWLRGLEAGLTIEADRIVAEGSLDIQRAKQEEGGLKLPSFNFFGGGSKAEKETETEPEDLPPPRPSAE